MPVLARVKPVDLVATKNVFISAIRFATKVDGPFGDELRISAQEQVEYMLGDELLVAADGEVKSETKTGLSNTFSLFESQLSDVHEDRIMRCLLDLEWMCGVLLKMGLMDDFVSKWIDASESVLRVVGDEKLGWGLKVKVVQVTSRVLDAVGYGNVILPAPLRVRLLNTWLPFLRKLKPRDIQFPDRIASEELWQSVEGAIVSLVSALPSHDQADILADWINNAQHQLIRYPDLSEAFEVWCFRTKSAKRRLV